jgi:hypothetical protein
MLVACPEQVGWGSHLAGRPGRFWTGSTWRSRSLAGYATATTTTVDARHDCHADRGDDDLNDDLNPGDGAVGVGVAQQFGDESADECCDDADDDGQSDRDVLLSRHDEAAEQADDRADDAGDGHVVLLKVGYTSIPIQRHGSSLVCWHWADRGQL